MYVCMYSYLSRVALQVEHTFHPRRLYSRYSVYLLFWYKSTNTDAWGAAGSNSPTASVCALAIPLLLALLLFTGR
jgi:hypothetical protein